MGFYINDLPNGEPLPRIGKADALIESGIAEETVFPEHFDDIPVDKAIIAVVDNRVFDAAAYMDSHIYYAIKRERDGGYARPTRFLLMNREVGMKLSGLWEYLEIPRDENFQ